MSDPLEALLNALSAQMPELVAAMEPDKRQALEDVVNQVNGNRKFIPTPGPQSEAYYSKADILLYGGQAGGGKALAIQTLIPTSQGWTAMADLKVGDTVFADTGLPCTIVAATEVMVGRPCYRLTFSDGAEMVADAQHEWATTTQYERDRAIALTEEFRSYRRSKRSSRAVVCSKKPGVSERVTQLNKLRQHAYKSAEGPIVRTTEAIAQTVGERHAVALNGALHGEGVLPINPYLLGAWLGDGTSATAAITIAEPEMVAHVQDAAGGYVVGKRASKYCYGITGGFQVALRTLGVLGNKHIPVTYLRAHDEQRRELLRGLMDTDGYADTRGQCEFTSVSRTLADGVAELLRTLGVKVTISTGVAKLNGREIGPKYRLKFLAPFPAFKLSRKVARQKVEGFRSTVTQRYVVACEAIESVPVRCIEVDSPSHMFLAGPEMIPTHNSALGLGLALTQHANSLIMRKRFNDLSALTKECVRFCKTREGFSQSPRPKMLTDDGRNLDFGAAQHVGDEESYQGHPYDLLYLDEASQFLEVQVRFLMGWNRTTGDNPGQRCRVVLGSNPPLTSEGDWMVDMFAPWLDPTYPEPAQPGELRWVISDEDGKDRWVKGSEPVYVGGRFVKPLSRTFVPASLKDNPFLNNTGYDAKLDAMPEPLRSAMRDGNFMTARMDADDQVIPTSWVIEAQKRWTPEPPMETPMCAMGLDPAKGGGDETAIAPRYNHWYAPLIVVPGRETPTGPDSAALVIKNRRHGAVVVVDVGGGYGDSCFDVLKANLQSPQGAKVIVAFDGSKDSTAKTSGGTLPFLNKRAEAWWRFREALDPGQEGGSMIALPPDPKLVADLTAPRLDKNILTLGKIKIEGKPELKARLGRSPDRGDAVVMAWSEGNHALTHATIWRNAAKRMEGGGRPQVVMGYEGRRR